MSLGLALLAIWAMGGCTSDGGPGDIQASARDVEPPLEDADVGLPLGGSGVGLQHALVRLEIAMDRAGHVLADPAMRPPGRDRSELEEAVIELLGAPLPDELITLWGWWGSSTLPDETRKVRPTVLGLPGTVRPLSLEGAIRQRNQLANSLSGRTISQRWLPIAYQGGDLYLWADLEACANGISPITVVDMHAHPEDGSLWEFSSVAALVAGMAFLLDEQILVYDSLRGWRHDGHYSWPLWEALGSRWNDRYHSANCDPAIGPQDPVVPPEDTSTTRT